MGPPSKQHRRQDDPHTEMEGANAVPAEGGPVAAAAHQAAAAAAAAALAEQQAAAAAQQQAELARQHAVLLANVMEGAIRAGVQPITATGDDLQTLDAHQLAAWAAEHLPPQ